MLNSKIVQFLEENKFTITISIDGNALKTNINRKTILGDGAYNYIISNIKLLKNFNMIARVTITDSNMDLIENHKHLYKLGFKSIAQSESYERIEMRKYKCSEFIAYSTCSGGCYHSNIIFKDYDSSNSPFCKLTRTKITNAIKVYSKLDEFEKEILFANMY